MGAGLRKTRGLWGRDINGVQARQTIKLHSGLK